jgi:hypothetical protein
MSLSRAFLSVPPATLSSVKGLPARNLNRRDWALDHIAKAAWINPTGLRELHSPPPTRTPSLPPNKAKHQTCLFTDRQHAAIGSLGECRDNKQLELFLRRLSWELTCCSGFQISLVVSISSVLSFRMKKRAKEFALHSFPCWDHLHILKPSS